MATYSSIAWRIPWTEDPGGLQSVGSQKSDMTEQINLLPELCWGSISFFRRESHALIPFYELHVTCIIVTDSLRNTDQGESGSCKLKAMSQAVTKLGSLSSCTEYKQYFSISATQMALAVKNLPAHTGDTRDVGSIPGSRPSPGGGHDNPLQYSCLENSVDRGGWRATVHGASKSWTWLSSQHKCKGSSHIKNERFLIKNLFLTFTSHLLGSRHSWTYK